jgi:hypothetical protein
MAELGGTFGGSGYDDRLWLEYLAKAKIVAKFFELWW